MAECLIFALKESNLGQSTPNWVISGSMPTSQEQAPVARRSLCWRVLKTVAAQCARQLQATSQIAADDSFGSGSRSAAYSCNARKSWTHPSRQPFNPAASLTRKVIHFALDLKLISQPASTLAPHPPRIPPTFIFLFLFANWFHIHSTTSPALILLPVGAIVVYYIGGA